MASVTEVTPRAKKSLTMMVSALLLCSVFVVSHHAEAKRGVKPPPDKINMSAYSCKDLLAENVESMGAVILWIDGYLSGKTGDTTLSMEFLSNLGQAVGAQCAANPKAKVLDVVAQMIGLDDQ
jgi:acid stress chaperone HdeB